MRNSVFIFLLFFASIIAQGQGNIHYLNNLKQSEALIYLTSNTNEKITLEVNINSYELKEIKISKGISYKLTASNGSPMLEKGSPDLAKLAQSVIIPDVEAMNLKIIGTDYIEIGNIEIAPSKGNIKRNINPNTIEYTWNENYTKDEFFPGKLGELNDPYILRDFRGQSVWIYPYQYNPVQKVLRVYTKLEIELVNSGEQGINPKIESSQKLNKAFNSIYQKQFLNYKKSTKYAPISDEGNMLVISHPDFIDGMQEFIDWKRQKGLNIEMISLDSIGYVSILIQNFVKDYYYSHGLTYLLLVGDAEHISPLTKSGDSDAAYGHIEGDDSYAEVFVGRFSAQSDLDLQVQIERSIFYERDIDENADWLNKAIGIASDEGGVGIGDDDERDKEHMDNIRQDLLNFGYTQVDQVYDPGAYALKVQEAINEGRSLINYVGHGSNIEWITTGFTPAKINELTNEYKYSYIFDVACVNGNFKGLTCFAEEFVRAHNDSIPTGAVAIIASTINQEWAPPMDAQDEMIDILVESYEDNIKRSFGGITINGCMHMNDHYGNVGSAMTDTWAIFGDPSLVVRTKQPEKMVVSHSEVIITGMDNFEVNCDTENAFVVLSNSDSIVASGYVTNGVVNFDITNIKDDFAGIITITAYNKVTYQSNIDIVTSEGPYIVVKSVTFTDNERIVKGQLDYNEEVSLDFELENVGMADANNLTATLVQHSEYVTLHTNCENQNIGNLASGEISKTSNQFIISVSDSVFNQMNLKFDLTIKSTETNEAWVRELNFKVNAPEIEIAKLNFTEVEGDNNSRIDPGEKVQVSINLSNIGNASAGEVEFSVGSNSPYININLSENLITDLQISSTYEINAEIFINAATPVGLEIPLYISVNSGIKTVAR